MKRATLPALLALCLTLPLLPGCGRDKGSATPQAAQEFAELREEQRQIFAQDDNAELQQEIAALLSRFEKTADARLASTPHRITLLHLACVCKKTELARCLLLDGADPNARQLMEAWTEDMQAENEDRAPELVPGDSPLTWAAIPYKEYSTAEELLALVNLLVENGADVNLPGPLGLPPLVSATLSPTPACEAVFLRLLELGARCPTFTPTSPADRMPVPLAALVAANNWSHALEKLLETGAPMFTPTRSALHAAAAASSPECVKILLAHGAEVDALNAEGDSALCVAARNLGTQQELAPRELEAVTDTMALLLQQGADPLRRSDSDPEFPSCCPADFIAMCPQVKQALEERGITVPRSAIRLEAEGELLLTEICRASLFGATAEEIRPHVAKLAAVLLSPTQEQLHSRFYLDAMVHATALLVQADAARAAELVANHPLWQEEEAWKAAQPRTGALLQAVLDCDELVMPRATLLEHARRMNAWGVNEVAALLTELLVRDTEAEADIEVLCSDAAMPLRAGALTARLLRAGLPAPRNAAVQEWMKEHGIAEEEAPPALRRALLLTGLDKFWYGQMNSEQVRELLQAMRDIGAPHAADFYAQLAPNLNKPEMLDELTAPGGPAEPARFELECATALFLWSQREELTALREAAEEEAAAANEVLD